MTTRRVTYMRNLDTFLFRNSRYIEEHFGSKYAHAARLTNLCLVWMGTARPRELWSWE